VEAQGAHTAVVLHGLLGQRRNWRNFTSKMASEVVQETRKPWKMLTVDLRCHGESNKLKGFHTPHDLKNSASDLLKFVQQTLRYFICLENSLQACAVEGRHLSRVHAFTDGLCRFRMDNITFCALSNWAIVRSCGQKSSRYCRSDHDCKCIQRFGMASLTVLHIRIDYQNGKKNL
jgi:hypothetical protein